MDFNKSPTHFNTRYYFVSNRSFITPAMYKQSFRHWRSRDIDLQRYDGSIRANKKIKKKNKPEKIEKEDKVEDEELSEPLEETEPKTIEFSKIEIEEEVEEQEEEPLEEIEQDDEDQY